jgi:hypothetical protein
MERRRSGQLPTIRSHSMSDSAVGIAPA